jgi:hypothetical protein
MKKLFEFFAAASCGWLLVSSGGLSSGKTTLPTVYETEADCEKAGLYTGEKGYLTRRSDTSAYKDWSYFACYPDAQSVKDLPAKTTQ